MGRRTLNTAIEKWHRVAFICIVPIVATTPYVIGKIKKLFNFCNIASTINSFSGNTVCKCSLLSSDDTKLCIDLLEAHEWLEICSNMQDDDFGHSHLQEVAVQQLSRSLNGLMPQRELQHFWKSLQRIFSRCPDLSRSFPPLSKGIEDVVTSKLFDYHLASDIVLFVLWLYHNDQSDLCPPSKTEEESLVCPLALQLYFISQRAPGDKMGR